ncbi:MAG: hypothetical protein GY795_20100 [Desulfobacterales bacterium]|nr:hypothetical protein [Desulfobacterales bacterium]
MRKIIFVLLWAEYQFTWGIARNVLSVELSVSKTMYKNPGRQRITRQFIHDTVGKVPIGTADNSPAIHCRVSGITLCQVPSGTTEIALLLPSLTGLDRLRHSDPAMNCRAIFCRPYRDFEVSAP